MSKVREVRAPDKGRSDWEGEQVTDTRPRETLSVMILSAERTTSPKGRTYLAINTAGHGKLSCWDAKLFDKIPSQGAATLVVEQNGSFRNVVDVGSAAQVAAPNASATDPRQWSITRQSALNAAIATLALPSPEPRVYPNTSSVLTLANVYHAWLLGQEVEEEPPF